MSGAPAVFVQHVRTVQTKPGRPWIDDFGINDLGIDDLRIDDLGINDLPEP